MPCEPGLERLQVGDQVVDLLGAELGDFAVLVAAAAFVIKSGCAAFLRTRGACTARGRPVR